MEWCHRFWRRGWKVLYTPAASAYHAQGKSSEQKPVEWRTRLTRRCKYRFCREHYGDAATRAIQAADAMGAALRVAALRRRGPLDEPARAELARYAMDRAIILELLRAPLPALTGQLRPERG